VASDWDNATAGGSSGEDSAYATWKAAVGLPGRFPELEPIAAVLEPSQPGYDYRQVFDHQFYLSHERGLRAQEIIASLGDPNIAVVVPVGHGCTTLSQLVLERSSQDSVRSNRIPIRISLQDNLFRDDRAGGADPLQLHERPRWSEVKQWSDSDRRSRSEEFASSAFAWLSSPDHVEDLIEDSVREGVVRHLVFRSWDRVLGSGRYAELLGCRSQGLPQLEEAKRRLTPLVGHHGIDWEVLAEFAPLLSQPLADLIENLNSRDSIRISLQIDLSSSSCGRWQRSERALGNEWTDPGLREELCEPYRHVVELFGDALRNMGRLGLGIPRVVGVTLFLGHDALRIIESTWRESCRTIELRAFNLTDVFAILRHRYPYRFETGGERTDLLTAVLDPKILAYEHMVGPTIALSTTVGLLEDYLRSWLDDSGIDYQVDASSFARARARPRTPSANLEEVAGSVRNIRAELKELAIRLDGLGELGGRSRRR
jgi:hypothetical protein